jgi:hypothetical protein
MADRKVASGVRTVTGQRPPRPIQSARMKPLVRVAIRGVTNVNTTLNYSELEEIGSRHSVSGQGSVGREVLLGT